MDLSDIKNKLQHHKKALFAKYRIKNLAIFGSFSYGEASTQSDIDLLVEFKEPIGIEFIDLADELELLLGNKIDLVSRNGIKQRYFQHIESSLNYV